MKPVLKLDRIIRPSNLLKITNIIRPNGPNAYLGRYFENHKVITKYKQILLI